MAALRTRQRALDARPIKKIAEAKARKKFKATQRLEKAMKKAEGVQDASDLSERAKAQQIEKLMRKGTSNGKPKKDIKVVVAKGSHRGLKGRPKGVKGRYKMVDSRMKKEVIPAVFFCFFPSEKKNIHPFFPLGPRSETERESQQEKIKVKWR